MKTVALRYAEKFAPEKGTIAAHTDYINKRGYVWYGKMGAAVSAKVMTEVLKCETPRILLIHSGHTERYWAYITEIKKERPQWDEFPDYYHDRVDNINTWFKVVRFEPAEKDILSKCFVESSGATLSLSSKYSMSPYFIINYIE